METIKIMVKKELYPIIIGKLLNLSGILQKEGNRILLPYDLNQQQFSIFFEIAKVEKVRQRDMVNRLMLEKAHVSKVVKKLTIMGLIKIDESEDDKRSYWLSVTEKGKKIKTEILMKLESWNEGWFESFSENELEQILDSISKVQQTFINKLNE